MPSRLPPLALVLAASLAACSGGDDENTPPDTTSLGAAATATESAAPSAASAPSTAPTDDASAPITEADFALYERGLEGEIAAYEAAAAARGRARTAADTAMAMMSAVQPAPAESAAARAGIPRARYQHLETVIGGAIGRSVMNPAMAKTMGADTSSIATLPADAQQRMRDNIAQMAAMNSDSAIYDGVPEAVRAPLKARAGGRMGELWRKRTEVLAKAMSGR